MHRRTCSRSSWVLHQKQETGHRCSGIRKAHGRPDALLSIVQMPKGVPVACVGIDNGENAAHLAARILGAKKEKKISP